jgi:DNA-binding NarL/FixJ family response regulator
VNKIRVLIADDSAQLRHQLIAILKDLPEVEIVGEAEDCVEAIFAIRALKPDVVVLDVRMPRGNGIEVLSSIRQDTHFPIVMMLSNHATPPYQVQATRAGAAYFFDKANGIEQVKQTMNEIITDSQPVAVDPLPFS